MSKRRGWLVCWVTLLLAGSAHAAWMQDKRIGSAVVADDQFGSAVALAGDWAAVGNPNDDDRGTDSGSVYVYHHDGTNWGQIAKLLASNGAAGDHYGVSVAINDAARSSHGETWVLVGVPDGSSSGKVYFYRKGATSWPQYQTFASDHADGDRFGTSVWMDPKGRWAIVGSPGDDDKGDDSGSAYVYKYNGATWVQTKKLIASNGAAGDHYGTAVAITDPNSAIDGDEWALVGAPDGTGPAADSGKVYFYKNGITSWPQWQTYASDGGAGDHYGSVVAIAGGHAIVGAPDDDNENGTDAGSMYTYVYRALDNKWVQYRQVAWSTEADAHDHFGLAVAITDGYCVAGTPDDDDGGTEGGSAFVYALYEHKRAGWPWLRYFASDAQSNDQYGLAVALDGDRMIVGAPFDDNGQGTDAGAAYFYHYEPGALTVTQPNGGERVISGQPYEITWDTTGRIDRVFLEYSADEGGYWTEIDTATNFGSSAESYTWDFPDVSCENCLLRASDYFDPSVFDSSDDFFSVFQCNPGLTADLTDDCYVDVVDLSALSTQWLQNGAVIYDYDSSTQLGDDVFGTIVCDFANEAPGRCSHGGPVCLEYPNGDLAAFHTNTSGHNLDGWSEYAVSRDGGKTWDKYNQFPYSYDAYQSNPAEPAWVVEGLVTQQETVVLFITRFLDNDARRETGVMRSADNGATWTDCAPLPGVSNPNAAAVQGSTNYVLFDDSATGLHLLYVSTDDGLTWQKRSTLSLDADKWYGALCVMADGRLLAGAYDSDDEEHFHYCISEDDGYTWGPQKHAYLDKKIRDPELAYLAGNYYLHGRSGHFGEGRHRFVMYQSDDGENWQSGVIISGDERGPDGYSHNCIINQHQEQVPNELMVEYSIIYADQNTNEYVFFVKPQGAAP